MLALVVLCVGQVPPPVVGAPDINALAASLRGYLAERIPPVLLEDRHNWGHQKQALRGLKRKGHKNQGIWRKLTLTSINPPQTLVLDLRDARQVGPGRMTFTTFVALGVRADYEQQNWRAGIRVYSGSVRARLRIKATLTCEVTSRLEKTNGLLPEVVFRFRVLASDAGYDGFVVEHIGGVGGDLAKVLGKAAHDTLHQWKPSLERNLLSKANAAILKAGDTRDIHLSLEKLLN
jgi:hypothetical protein